MAIESLERSLDFFGAPVFVYHEIVHNKYVVERFKSRGVVFVEPLEEVPLGPPLLHKEKPKRISLISTKGGSECRPRRRADRPSGLSWGQRGLTAKTFTLTA